LPRRKETRPFGPAFMGPKVEGKGKETKHKCDEGTVDGELVDADVVAAVSREILGFKGNCIWLSHLPPCLS
jgi:hypothetical protein